MFETLYSAMRLALFGWCLMLASLVIRRTIDRQRKTYLRPGYLPIRLPESPALLALAASFCAVVLSTYTRIVIDTLRQLPRSEHSFPEVFVSTTAFMVATVIFVDRISYHRSFKVKWMTGWAGFSLLITGLQVLW